jgi:hypothetical protein
VIVTFFTGAIREKFLIYTTAYIYTTTWEPVKGVWSEIPGSAYCPGELQDTAENDSLSML